MPTYKQGHQLANHTWTRRISESYQLHSIATKTYPYSVCIEFKRGSHVQRLWNPTIAAAAAAAATTTATVPPQLLLLLRLPLLLLLLLLLTTTTTTAHHYNNRCYLYNYAPQLWRRTFLLMDWKGWLTSRPRTWPRLGSVSPDYWNDMKRYFLDTMSSTWRGFPNSSLQRKKSWTKTMFWNGYYQPSLSDALGWYSYRSHIAKKLYLFGPYKA